MARQLAPRGPLAEIRGQALLLYIDVEPPGLNGALGQLRSGFRARHKLGKRIEGLMRLALVGKDVPPAPVRARVTYIRSYRHAPLDPDNLYASAKSVLDALQRLGIILSDKPQDLDLKCDQRPRAGRAPFFQLRIEPCKDS